MAQTTGVMDSNVWVLLIDDTVAGCLQSNSLSMSRETRDVTCKTGTTDNTYRSFLPSFITGTISFEGFHAEDDANESSYELHTKFKAGTRIAWKAGSTIIGDKYYSGNGYITQLDINAGAPGENVSYSGTVTIDGEVTEATNA